MECCICVRMPKKNFAGNLLFWLSAWGVSDLPSEMHHKRFRNIFFPFQVFEVYCDLPTKHCARSLDFGWSKELHVLNFHKMTKMTELIRGQLTSVICRQLSESPTVLEEIIAFAGDIVVCLSVHCVRSRENREESTDGESRSKKEEKMVWQFIMRSNKREPTKQTRPKTRWTRYFSCQHGFFYLDETENCDKETRINWIQNWHQIQRRNFPTCLNGLEAYTRTRTTPCLISDAKPVSRLRHMVP